ncbi:hypothetical protein QBC47DRAFT_375740 [Echria macrotheca]|uniref:Uncharacterized protein n=1 Tax=Echria macrotheca TaxID=438768 RepID=A0AAJ0F7X8_9PEZI|nr:hypothetical protein QBC47DRAFT_375740 [Echria macrotheca]
MSDFGDSDQERQFHALEELEDEGVQTFDIELNEEGDGGLHTKNDPEAPFQRSTVTQRKGDVDVKATLRDVVHGQWGEDDPDASATLLVLLFRFDPRRQGRRISYASLSFRFFDGEGRHRKNPEVVAISFDGNLNMVPTKRTESVTKGADGTVGGGLLGAELSTTVKWEKKIDEETSDSTKLVGSIDILEAPHGPNNAATWTLTENQTTKTGIPAAMQVGILLKRTTDDDFHCAFEIKTDVDFRTSIKHFLKRQEKDDPILFRTDLKPTNKLMQYDVANLGSFDVSRVEDLSFTTMRNNVIKESG